MGAIVEAIFLLADNMAFVLLSLLLLLPAMPAQAQPWSLQFIGPELPGIFQIRDGQAYGALVDTLSQLEQDSAMVWQYRHASPARVALALASSDDTCSLSLQAADSPHPYQLVATLGRSSIVAYSRIDDPLTLSALGSVPVSQRLSFGSGLRTLLRQHRQLDSLEHPSLATAVQLVSLGRARVLLTTQISMYALQPAPLLRRIGTLDHAQNVLVCARGMPAATVQRLRSALARLVIPFTL